MRGSASKVIIALSQETQKAGSQVSGNGKRQRRSYAAVVDSFLPLSLMDSAGIVQRVVQVISWERRSASRLKVVDIERAEGAWAKRESQRSMRSGMGSLTSPEEKNPRRRQDEDR